MRHKASRPENLKNKYDDMRKSTALPDMNTTHDVKAH